MEETIPERMGIYRTEEKSLALPNAGRGEICASAQPGLPAFFETLGYAGVSRVILCIVMSLPAEKLPALKQDYAASNGAEKKNPTFSILETKRVTKSGPLSPLPFDLVGLDPVKRFLWKTKIHSTHNLSFWPTLAFLSKSIIPHNPQLEPASQAHIFLKKYCGFLFANL